MKLSVSALCATLLLSASDFAAADDIIRRNKPSRKLSKSSSSSASIFSLSDCELPKGSLAPTDEGVTTACVGKCGTDIRFINADEQECGDDEAEIKFGEQPPPPTPPIFTTVTETFSTENNNESVGTVVNCPPGFIAVGGGFVRDGNGAELEMRSNGPVTNADGISGWLVEGQTTNANDVDFLVTVNCFSGLAVGAVVVMGDDGR